MMVAQHGEIQQSPGWGCGRYPETSLFGIPTAYATTGDCKGLIDKLCGRAEAAYYGVNLQRGHDA